MYNENGKKTVLVGCSVLPGGGWIPCRCIPCRRIVLRGKGDISAAFLHSPVDGDYYVAIEEELAEALACVNPGKHK